jgi:O-acetyl-ADP-ribose deacetylase (regulator of RNase III)
MRETCDGMQAAADEGIIHRDLKPSNILIDHRGKARVADFGLAKRPLELGSGTSSRVVLGTPTYMAPEQAEDPTGVDTRADVYSFGASYYHALTGRCPFEGKTPFSVLFKHKTEPLISPKARQATISNRTSELLERCLAKSPDERFQSFADVRRNLAPHKDGAHPWDYFHDEEFSKYQAEYLACREQCLNSTKPVDKTFRFPEGRVLQIKRGNIAEEKVEAIVSSDDAQLTMGGGVSWAIRHAAGEEIEREARVYRLVRAGRAVVTSGGRLSARFVFHGITLGKGVEPSRDLISEIMRSCFYQADTLHVTSLAFPLLGTGVGGFSKKVCLDTTFRFAARMLLHGRTAVRDVRIVLFDPRLRELDWYQP